MINSFNKLEQLLCTISNKKADVVKLIDIWHKQFIKILLRCKNCTEISGVTQEFNFKSKN